MRPPEKRPCRALSANAAAPPRATMVIEPTAVTCEMSTTARVVVVTSTSALGLAVSAMPTSPAPIVMTSTVAVATVSASARTSTSPETSSVLSRTEASTLVVVRDSTVAPPPATE